jgi:polyferredoxin
MKGRFTIRSAGTLFLLSAAFEIWSITSPIPLFGAIRSGALAITYHLLFIALFLTIGIVLLVPKQWGYKAAFVGAFFSTLDNVLFLLDRKSMDTYMLQQLGSYNSIIQTIGMSTIYQVLILTTLMFIASWWGFVLYLHIRRDYFYSQKSSLG